MEEVFGGLAHPHVWKEVSDWLDERCEHRSPRGPLGLDSVAILVGPSGVGKSYGLERILQAKGWEAVRIDQETSASAREFQEAVTKGITTNLLQALSGSVCPRVLLLDNADALFHSERMYAVYLMELLEKRSSPLPHMPIVITCSYGTEKRLGAIRRCKQFILHALSERDIFLYLKRFYRLPAKDLMAVAEACNGSIGVAIGLVMNHGTGTIGARRDAVAEQHMMYMARGEDARQVRSLVEDKLWISPLLFHENLLTELGRRKGTQRAKRDFYRKYLWALATWDVWMVSVTNNEETGSAEYPIELVTRNILHMGELFPKRTASVSGEEESFTRLFSTLSIQKKTARMAYSQESPF